MNVPQNQTFSLRDFYTTIFRRKQLIKLCFLFVILAVGVYVICVPNTYRSMATIIVNLGRENVTLDPTATTGKTVTIEEDRDSEINSEAELLKSKDLAGQIVNEMGADKILNGSGDDLSTEDSMSAIRYWAKQILMFPFTKIMNLFDSQPNSAVAKFKKQDKAIDYVEKHLSIEQVKKSDIIAINYDAGNPRLAQNVVDKLIKAYLKKHLLAHQTAGSYTFFAEQKMKLRTSLEEAENKLRQIKNTTGIASISEQKKILLERLGGLRTTLERAQSHKASTSAKIATLENTLSKLPRTLRKDEVTGFANSSFDEVQKRVYELQLREHELQSKYKDDAPPIIAIRRQIQKGQALLSTTKQLKQINLGVNDTYQKLQFNLVTDKSLLSATEADISVLSEQIKKEESDLHVMNNTEMQINRLDREVEILRSNYIKYSESKEQARIDQALKLDNISSIRIVQPASYSLIPVRPKRKLILVLGLFLAIFGSLGAAFFRDHLDHSLNDIDDIDGHLRLPVLTTIPHSCLERPLDRLLIQGTAQSTITVPAPVVEFNGDEESCRAMLRLTVDEDFEHFSYALGFVGCQPQDGTSTVVNLFARQMALQSASRILVVDTNIYNPQQHTHFKTKLTPGFTDLINKCSDLRCIQTTSIPNLDVLSTGERKDGFPACKVLTHLLPVLKASYNYIIFDLPPMQSRSPILQASRLMDGIALLVEAEKTRWEVAAQAKQDLGQMQSNLLGIVLNKKRFHIPEWLYKRL